MFDVLESPAKAIVQREYLGATYDIADVDFPSELEDRLIPNTPREGERRTFELPAIVWKVMVSCYAVFLAAMLGSLGGGRASFAIAVSAVYVSMFFGVATLMARQSPRQSRSILEHRSGALQTIYGPMFRTSVFAQILVVPLAVALFGVIFAVIRLALA